MIYLYQIKITINIFAWWFSGIKTQRKISDDRSSAEDFQNIIEYVETDGQMDSSNDAEESVKLDNAEIEKTSSTAKVCPLFDQKQWKKRRFNDGYGLGELLLIFG